MPRAGFEPSIPAIERPQTYASDSVANGISYRNEAPRTSTNRHMKLVRLLVLGTRRQYVPSPQEIFLVLISLRG